ncbi:RNA polymerase subunit sigma-70 [Bosea sp. Root483D1]|uniref:sigma-70 family RNA polymerase sigma factor n=1 Tax=Bosea sp. Root483D1 TaxID=1736544 RepID=UPI00070BEC68|nr:RNA polymerase subunit sigma-70 [Bosea sp. Root483D1]
MSRVPPEADERENFDAFIVKMRPKLHRYCSRMVGSVVDGEDVVQETLLKAVGAHETIAISNVEGWLFRVAHHAAIDFLRRRRRQKEVSSDDDIDGIVDETMSADRRHVTAANLRTLMHLPAAQRGCIILMDVLGYSLHEVGNVTGLSVPGVKAALHRGRAKIRDIASRPDEAPAPRLKQEDLKRLSAYVERFNSHDFDAVRAMLADDVRLELVSRTRMVGREEVSRYFHNYERAHDWRLAPGLVDGHLAALVLNTAAPLARPKYFVIIDWRRDSIYRILDFRHASYVAESADLIIL